MLKWLKNTWPWKKKPTKSEVYEQVTNAFAVEYKKRIKPKKADKAIWPKDFKAEDVAKALDKQAPKPKETKVATKPGLYANIHAKQKRIEKQKADGKPVETMRKPGTKGAPTAKNFKEAAKTATKGKK